MIADVYFVDVLLPLPLEGAFTYSVPEKEIDGLTIGCRVLVQFGKRKVYSGIVMAIHHTKPAEYEVKDILSVLDAKPVVRISQIKLWKWISEYYLCTLGEVMKAALPSALKLESETEIIFNTGFDDFKSLTDKEMQLVDIIASKEKLSIQDLQAAAENKNVMLQINSLIKKQAVLVEEKTRQSYKPKIQQFLRLHSSISSEAQLAEYFDTLNSAPKQLAILMTFIQACGKEQPFGLEKSKIDILKKCNATQATLSGLIKKEVFEIVERKVNRFDDTNVPVRNEHPLNKYQDIALKETQKTFIEKEVCLLHGVTSSGKTEVYIHLIKEQIKEGKQVLYLLPEIALTIQLVQRLKAVFGKQVGIYHSKYPDNFRYELWEDLMDNEEGTLKIVLGARSALFLPFSNLGLIIVDEEHENTYKQYDPAPRYHARDSAIVLASQHKAKVLLGTATPSMETYFNCKIGKYGLVELNQRFGNMELPQIHVADLSEAYRKKAMHSHFTPLLMKEIESALSQNEQVILFQNRRGFSSFLECLTCGYVPHCVNCDVSMTYHKYSHNLVCHYCGYSQKMPPVCPSCGASSLETKGFGTEKIEDEIGIYFPEARIKRMDLDSTRTRKAYEKIIIDFENGDTNILIGTQMVTKGLDFDNVSVVGVLNADNMINFPDFRAFERSYQMLAQVSGRAGRKKKQGKVIVQTYSPKHPVILNMLENNYKRMFQQELVDRKDFKYPPYYRLLVIIIKHKQSQVLNKAAAAMAKDLHRKFGARVIGPEYPLVSRTHNWYQKNIMLKLEREGNIMEMKKILRSTITEFLFHFESKSLQIVFDVDPY